MDDLMADAELYNNPSKIKQAQKAYSLVLKDLQNKEDIWLEAQEACEKAS